MSKSRRISETEQFVPEISRRSAQRKLGKLVDDGYLKKTGEACEAKYIPDDVIDK